MSLIFSGNGTLNVSGVLPIAQGGTGETTKEAAINALLPDQAAASNFVLSTDGSNVLWVQQSGGTGLPTPYPDDGSLFLTSIDGYTLSWQPAGGGGSSNPAGTNGQLQYNNNGAMGGAARMNYNDTDVLTVGSGTSETFSIRGREALNALQGGSTVTIRGGNYYTDPLLPSVPAAGNVQLIAGGGSGTNGEPGYIAFRVGRTPSETFRIVAGGGWAFDGIGVNQGELGYFLMSQGSGDNPIWSALPYGSTTEFGVFRLAPDPSGLVLSEIPASGGLQELSAYIVDVDGITLERDSNGIISANTGNFFPNQTGKNGLFLQTDGAGNLDWADPIPTQTGEGGKYLKTNGIQATWEDISVATTSNTGVVKVDGTTITVSGEGEISAQLTGLLPSLVGNTAKVLTVLSDSQVYWKLGDYTLPPATESTIGGVRPSSNMTVNVDGVIDVKDTKLVPPMDGLNAGYYLRSSGDNTIPAQWTPEVYQLVPASTSRLGGVKVDGSTIQINAANVISANINNLVPSQSGNANYFLTTNGTTVRWNPASISIASPSVLGGIKPDGITVSVTEEGVLSAINIDLDSGSSNKLLYNSSGSVGYTNKISYDGTNTLTVGNRTDSSLFSITGEVGVEVYGGSGKNPVSGGMFSSGLSGTAGGAVLIRGGDAAAEGGPGGNISLIAGPGINAVISGGAGVTQQAGSIAISSGQGAGGGGSGTAPSYGGSISFNTALTGPVQSRLVITNSGGWQVGSSSDGGYGPAGGTLITPGAYFDNREGWISNGPPTWGILGIDGGGTGATTKNQAVSNLLPTQGSGNIGKVLATDGANTYWWQAIPVQTGNSGNFLVTNGVNTEWAQFPYDEILPPLTGNSGNMLVVSQNEIDIRWAPPQIPDPTGFAGYGLVSDGTQSVWTPLNTPPLPVANTTHTGVIRVGTGLTIAGGGILSVNTATTSTLGSVIAGPGLSINGSGVLSLGAGSGILPVANGGTGATTASEALINLAGGATDKYYLQGDGTNIVLAPLDVDLTLNVSGVLSVANGGTGASNRTEALTNLLPNQSSAVADYFLKTNGSIANWSQVFFTPAGSNGQFQYNNGGAIAGTPRMALTGTSNNTLTLGIASTVIPSEGTFNIVGASSNGALYTPSNILIQGGRQVLSNRTAGNISLKGGEAAATGGVGGDVVLDAGQANTGGQRGGFVTIRTSDGPGTALTSRLEIGDRGAWKVNGDSGTAGLVLISNGDESPPYWGSVSAAGLEGPILPSTFVTSSLTTVGTLDFLNVAGNVGIGTETPQAPLVVSLGETSVGIEFQPDTSNSTISAINRFNNTYRTLALEGSALRFRTSSTTTQNDRLIIDGQGTWIINGNTGIAGQVLTSNGAGFSPRWSTPPGVNSVNVSGGTTGLTTTGGPITSSGTITIGGVLGVANGGTGANTGIDASQNVSNFGQLRLFGQVNDFNKVQQWGATYVAAATNGPNFPSITGQYYQMMLAMGSDYSWGSNDIYAAQLAIPRLQPGESNKPYLGIRFKNGGTAEANWGSWQKFSAGYADTAETANTANFATLAGNVTGVVAIANGGTGATTATAAINALLPSQATNANKALVTNGSNVSWRSFSPTYDYITASADQIVVPTNVNTQPNSNGISYIQVFRNGVLQLEGLDKSYTVTGLNQITFNFPLALNDDITIFSYV